MKRSQPCHIGNLLAVATTPRDADLSPTRHGRVPKSPFPALNGGDAAILFCFVFLYIAAAGPGFWSVDAQVRRAAI